MAEDVPDWIRATPPRNGAFYLVAVDGRGGSGKTTFAEHLIEQLPGFHLLHGDDYFEPTPAGPAWGDFNERRFRDEVIRPLRVGNSFIYRPYDWATQSYVDQEVALGAGVVIERCYSTAMDVDWDFTIWVETPPGTCLERGLARRDEPGELAEVRAVWHDIWQPRENEFIRDLDPAARADLVIDGTRDFAQQLRRLPDAPD